MHPYVTQPAVGSLTFWATAISLGVILTFTIPLLLGIVYVATQRKNNPSKEKQGLLESVTSTSSTSSVATTSSFPTSQTTLLSSAPSSGITTSGFQPQTRNPLSIPSASCFDYPSTILQEKQCCIKKLSEDQLYATISLSEDSVKELKPAIQLGKEFTPPRQTILVGRLFGGEETQNQKPFANHQPPIK